MTSVFYARDPVSGALLATLPSAMVSGGGEARAGLARRLRSLFVASGRLRPDEAERADFELRETAPSDPAQPAQITPL